MKSIGLGAVVTVASAQDVFLGLHLRDAFSDCPGGSLSTCIGMCPSSPASAFSVCIQECSDRCSGSSTPAPAPVPPPAPRVCQFKAGQNNGGTNIQEIQKVSSQEDCCDHCSQDANCVGFTFLPYNGLCYTKSSIDAYSSDENCVSGDMGGSPWSPSTPPPSPGCGPFDGTGFVAEHGRLKLGGSTGTQIVDECDRPVQLKGMSVFNPGAYDECITPDSIATMVNNWGITLLRVPFDCCKTSERHNYVNIASGLGIYVIVDYHYTGVNPIIDDNARNFWKDAATRYKDYNNIFYETFNEPGPDADWGSVIKPFHEEMLRVIRDIDTKAIVILGTRFWSGSGGQYGPADAAANPVDSKYNPVMYTKHFYAASHYDQDEFAGLLDHIPIFATEWGICEASGTGNLDHGSAQKWMDVLGGNNPSGVTVSWANWGYDDKNGETCAALNPGACNSGQWDSTSQSGGWAKEFIR